MQVTVNDLAKRLGVDYPVASALLKLMVNEGAASEVGKRPNSTGKGKPSTIFEIPESFTIDFKKSVKTAA